MFWRAYLLIGGLVAAATGLGYWSLRFEEHARRGELWAEQQASTATLAALRKPVELQLETTTLRDFARQISEATDVEIVLDVDRLNEVTIWSPRHNELGEVAPQAMPLHLPRATLPAEAALSLVLRQLKLEYDIRGLQVVITTADRLDDSSSLGVYPLPQPGPAAKTGSDSAAWADAVTSLIEPNSWDSVGGPGHCEAVAGGLVVVHSPRMQGRVRNLLEGLGRLESPPATWQSVPLSPGGPAWLKALSSLHQPVKIDCRQLPLIDLIEYLADEYRVPLVLNVQELWDAGIDRRTPITRKLSQVSLEGLLQAVLGELDLAFVVGEGFLEVTTKDDAQDRLWTVAFPVHDLVDAGGEPDDALLTDLIMSVVEPQQWDRVGGPGACGPIVGGWLVIAQTRELLVQVEQLLAQLRKRLSQADTPYVLASQPAVERIAAALERELPLEYERTTLSDMCQDLSQRLGICMVLDDCPLAEARINTTAPVTFRYEPAPLRMNLQRFCDALGMALAIRHDKLLLTTPDAAEESRCLRIHDVRPIIDPDLGLGDPNWLIDLVTAHIQPQSWDTVGGPGTIQYFRGLLVVAQSGEFQRETAALLAGLANVAGAGAPAKRVGVPSLAMENWSADHGTRSVPATLDPGDEAIRSRLQQPVTADFDELRLVEAVTRLARSAGVPLRIDRQGLRDEGIELDVPVTLHVRELPLAAALDRLLPRRLSHLIERRELLISTEDRRNKQRQMRLYDVRTLTAGIGGDAWLQDLIMAHVQPQSWDAVGGHGSITCHRGLLVVTQAPEIQREVEGLLQVAGTLRVPSLAIEGSIFNDGTPTRLAGAPVPATTCDDGLYHSLAGLVQLDLLETPLDEALARLSRIAGVPIWIDEQGLADMGIVSDTPVTLIAEDATLAGVLDRLLPAELGYFLQGGELVVTSADLAQSHFTTRLYRISAAEKSRDDITERAAIVGLPSDYWSDFGGKGEISAIANEWLLISADIVRHAQLEDWLTERQTGKPPLRALERRALDECRAVRHAELDEELGRAAVDPFAVPAAP